jgi:hypothetical protein
LEQEKRAELEGMTIDQLTAEHTRVDEEIRRLRTIQFGLHTVQTEKEHARARMLAADPSLRQTMDPPSIPSGEKFGRL